MPNKRRTNNLFPLLIAFLFTLLPISSAQAQNKALNRLYNDAATAAKKGKIQLSDSLYQAYANLFHQEGHPGNFQYSEALSYLARRASQKGFTDQAIHLQEQVIEIRRTAPDCNDGQWAVAISDLAGFYKDKGQLNKAIEIGQQALDMLRKKFGTKHHFYNISLANLASYYDARGETGDYDQAVSLGEKAIKNMKKGTPEYALALNSLVVFYSHAGNRFAANKLSIKARKEARKRMEEDGIGYAVVLNNNAIRLAGAGNYDQAIIYAKAAQDCYKQAGQQQTLGYSKLLTNMATFYSHQQQYQQAAEILEEALPIIEHATSRKHPDYIRCLSELSAVYKGMGNMEKADELAYQSDQISHQLGKQDDMKYAKSLSKQAAVFASNGNYSRAIEQEIKAINIYRQRRDSLSLAFSLGILANYNYNDGHRQQALSTAAEALHIFDRHSEPSAQWAQALNNTAILYYNYHDYQQASVFGQKAIDMYRLVGDTLNAIYARIVANKGLFLFMKDSLSEAIATATKAIALHQRVLGNEHPDNVPLLYNLAVYQSKAGNHHEAATTYCQALQIEEQQVRTVFLHLTSQEREKFWNKKNYVFRYAPLLAYIDREHNQQMVTEAYDSQLFSKGILLNSDIDFRNLLRRSGNQELLGKYNYLEQLHHELEDYYKLPADERDSYEMTRIAEESYQLERALVKGCKEYGDFTESLAINARQVAASLKSDEAAIEFADVYVEGMGTTYLALVLQKDWPQPRLVRLFSDAELRILKYGEEQLSFFQTLQDEQSIGLVYNDPRFGSMLWQPIVQLLQGVRKIYFSPTAMLYHLGIEYLPCDATQRIADRYKLYRLSSTKQLVQRKPTGRPKSAVVYGGLNYDMTLAEIQEQHDNISHTRNNEQLLVLNNTDTTPQTDMQRALDSLSLRGTVGYLQGTLHEAEDIAEQLLQNGVKAQIFLGNEGTEESFRALSSQPYHIVHIATHGFAFSEAELRQQGRQLAFLNEQTANLDNPLNYSGLLLSGANYVLSGNKLPDGLADGVLTAREIAQVDLSHTQLVVLSACQTGLGEIRDDGVFGIQRGFKKAGARALLMSLWKVSDQATDLMMTTFYERLVAGLSSHEAFAQAQQTVRQGGYEDPYFWASFILLDALE